MKRRSDSVRFDPYYKVQWWHPRNAAYVDVQHPTHTTIDSAERWARAEGVAGDRFRVMCVWPGGRRPVCDGIIE